MSYGTAAALQAAIYQHLRADAALVSLVGDAVFDAVPTGAELPVYVGLGPEDVAFAGDKTGNGARHRFTVSVVGKTAGFQTVKQVAGAVSDALHEATPAMSRGRIVRMQFLRAAARRTGTDNRRRIDLRFEARVEDD